MTDKTTMIKDLDKVMQDVDKMLADDYLYSTERYEQNPLVRCVTRLMKESTSGFTYVAELLGICSRDQASASGRKFSKFVTTTPYKNIACRLLEMLTNYETSWATSLGYQPAQDYLAEMCYNAPLKNKSSEEIKNRLRALRKYERHLNDGDKRGLTMEEVITHDEICGFFMDRFDDEILDAARRISSYMHTVMPKYAEGCDWRCSIYEQSEEVRRNVNTGLKQVADFIRDIRDKEFAEGWLDDDSLAFSYLMSHAEMLVLEAAASNKNKSKKQ